ncbi:hypothetical protein SARC_08716 [Sphaeroforma arctica JP610]|uniref:J domain-containing protein n=1 Tax=Sphaeroforma arctica JP610 TaxID=667725 RepID=A0A0L0FQ83_9EUKA|nr:hypothetical protein SARC_08716 [Sphaeroforma arctica JP610]KNC78869.1 hypothetical protein SARC_08716 [Sphaeroforma arctica JP610]|eukprot:XP_014152771.1 hypothetical protein SARC_08716 [Sphaeroforma arctica JP610]
MTLLVAQKQRQQAQKDQQAKANKQKEQNQWAKQRASAPSAGPSTGAPAVEFGGFGDLLGMHNFTPTEKDKPLQSMNDLREVEIMKNDEDGTSTTRLQVGKWTNGKTGNIRALISTLPEILWEGVEWEPIGIDKMLKPVGVKRSFMKACLVVHPDKVQDGENEYLASLIFDELNKAWTAFKEAGSPGLI